MGRLIGVSVNIDVVQSVVDFEMIEIVDGSTPYPTLLGLDWALDNYTIIDLNKRQMVFYVEDFKVTTPLDPTEGRRYVETTKRKELDNMYNMTTQMDDYMTPIVEGILVHVCQTQKRL